MSNITETPAVLGPVQQQVRLCAWQAVGGSIWGHKTSHDDRALYDRDALDAVAAAERERCATICDAYLASLGDKRTPHEMRLVAAILAAKIRA